MSTYDGSANNIFFKLSHKLCLRAVSLLLLLLLYHEPHVAVKVESSWYLPPPNLVAVRIQLDSGEVVPTHVVLPVPVS